MSDSSWEDPSEPGFAERLLSSLASGRRGLKTRLLRSARSDVAFCRYPKPNNCSVITKPASTEAGKAEVISVSIGIKENGLLIIGDLEIPFYMKSDMPLRNMSDSSWEDPSEPGFAERLLSSLASGRRGLKTRLLRSARSDDVICRYLKLNNKTVITKPASTEAGKAEVISLLKRVNQL